MGKKPRFFLLKPRLEIQEKLKIKNKKNLPSNKVQFLQVVVRLHWWLRVDTLQRKQKKGRQKKNNYLNGRGKSTTVRKYLDFLFLQSLIFFKRILNKQKSK